MDSLFDETATAPAKGASSAPSMFRSSTLREAPQGVDRETRTIRGYAVCTRGEALGHGFWCDDEFLEQIVKYGNRRKLGIKARFTHPGLSGDGLGRHLGRSVNFRKDGDVVRADLRLAEVASKSPEGDLAGYLMDLAEEDPKAFGSSIVFQHNETAEGKFTKENCDENGNFFSPDEDNGEHLPHARMRSLRAADVVGDPAANPGGFFSVGGTEELAARAETALLYAFGLTDEEPSTDDLGGIHPQRLRAFVSSFCERHNIGAKPQAEEEDEEMSKQEKLEEEDPKEKKEDEEQEEKKDEEEQQEEEEKKDEEEQEEKDDDEEQSEVKTAGLNELRANEIFGADADFVLEALDAGWPIHAAEVEYLKRSNAAKEKEITKLKSSAPPAGAGHVPSSDNGDFMERAKVLAKAENTKITPAMRKLAAQDPEGYRAYCERQGKK